METEEVNEVQQEEQVTGMGTPEGSEENIEEETDVKSETNEPKSEETFELDLNVIYKVEVKLKEETTDIGFHIKIFKGKPKYAPDVTETKTRVRRVIKYLDIVPKNENLDHMTLYFRLRKETVENPESVTLMHLLNGGWTPEPTEYLGVQGNYYIFRATVHSLSYFAIVELEPEQKPTEEKQEQEAEKEKEEKEKEVTGQPPEQPQQKTPAEETGKNLLKQTL